MTDDAAGGARAADVLVAVADGGVDTDAATVAGVDGIGADRAADSPPGDEDHEAAHQIDESTVKPVLVERRWMRLLAYRLLPLVIVVLAAATGFMKWDEGSVRQGQLPNVEAASAAREGTVAILSYGADSVERDLSAATSRLTGDFRDSYTKLIHDVVIPGARTHKVSATAAVPAVASVSASGQHAELLVFVNQTVTIGDGVPTSTASTVRVTVDKRDGRWLISAFNPI
ncbi:hypothetical protein [Mycolicibacterium sp. HS_4_1]